MSIEFKNRLKKISFSQINLKEFLKFYKEICLYKYTYVLDNQEEIILFFEENKSVLKPYSHTRHNCKERSPYAKYYYSFL